MDANNIPLLAADELGLILAQIAELTAKAEEIKGAMKDVATNGGGSVFEGNRKVTDWKAIAKVCNIPEDVIVANTTVTAVFSVKTATR
jgi:hypothetical protein